MKIGRNGVVMSVMLQSVDLHLAVLLLNPLVHFILNLREVSVKPLLQQLLFDFMVLEILLLVME